MVATFGERRADNLHQLTIYDKTRLSFIESIDTCLHNGWKTPQVVPKPISNVSPQRLANGCPSEAKHFGTFFSRSSQAREDLGPRSLESRQDLREFLVFAPWIKSTVAIL